MPFPWLRGTDSRTVPSASRTRISAQAQQPRLVGANTTSQIDDAVASLDIELAAEELAALEQPYTPRHDFQGISDEAELQKIRDQIPGYANA